MTDKIKKVVVTEGDGKTFPKQGDVVTVHYTGAFPFKPCSLAGTKKHICVLFFDVVHVVRDPCIKWGKIRLFCGQERPIQIHYWSRDGDSRVGRRCDDYVRGRKGTPKSLLRLQSRDTLDQLYSLAGRSYN